MIKHILYKPFCLLLFSATITACSGPEKEQKEVGQELFDPDSALNTVFDGKIFSIPSPIQTTYLIKELDIPFNEDLLSNDKKVDDYLTEYDRALSLGIYGTDLGYSAMYDEKGVTMRYLGAVEKLTSELHLDAAFNSDFLLRFERNNDNEDSMVMLMTQAFKEADQQMKSSNRKATSALVLTGGWVESLYLACELYAEKPDKEILKRIGIQRESISSIVSILTTYNNEGESDALIDQISGLQSSFDEIGMEYEYSATETNEAKHFSQIHHSLEIKISPQVMKDIRAKVAAIREGIINTSNT